MDRIAVGVDWTDNSRAALSWAIDEARARGAAVDAILVWHQPVYGGIYGVPLPPAGPEVEESYRTQLATLVEQVDSDGLGSPVGQLLRQGSASRELLAEAEHADLLVVGSRGHGGFLGLLLGSVSHQVAVHAPCPVVIVPAPVRRTVDE